MKVWMRDNKKPSQPFSQSFFYVFAVKIGDIGVKILKIVEEKKNTRTSI